MTRIRLPHILQPKEAIVLAVGLLVAGLVGAVVIAPSLQLVGNLEANREAKITAEKRVQLAQAQYQQTLQQISRDEAQLAQLGGSPPPATEKDILAARVTALAGECGITVDQFVPLDTVLRGDHQEFHLQYTGRGSYEAIQQCFLRLETEIEFVDITHFTITAVHEQGQTVCMVTWSCSILSMLPEISPPRQKPPVPSGLTATLEVPLGGS